ncbi:TPA: hypothetical protein EYP38_04485, partial [Candidatus Micrarchaeota archaeon]|nr:hypothetical protein [Candidatus Micrarchaeota archaeon]
MDDVRRKLADLNLDSSEKLLIASNLATIAMAVIFDYPLASIIWLYFIESVIIGFFAFFKILFVRGKSVKLMGHKVALAFFFAFHYGGFHTGYFFFLALMPWFAVGLVNLEYVLISAAILFGSHAFSFVQHVLKQHEGSAESRIQLLFTEPYARIIPMHLTIIGSGFIIVLGVVRSLL